MHKQQYLSKEYFSDHYGICNLKNCKCLIDGWNPKTCNNWKPFDINSHDELLNSARKIRNLLEGKNNEQ